MNNVGYIYDEDMLKHCNDEFHVESPERILSIYNRLIKTKIIDSLIKIDSYEITNEELEIVHTKKYISLLNDILNRKHIYISDNDMYGNSYTLISAKIAAGSVLNLTKKVIDKIITSGFAIVRPPGHHAKCEKYSGFCFFNNLAISAIYSAKQCLKTLIVDIDVHHGDGTERIIRKHKELRNILFFSIHRWDSGAFFPGSGKSIETERIINVGFNGSKGDGFYINVLRDKLLPRAKEFTPDIIFISAGFDAAEGDPLGGCNVTPDGYYKIVKLIQTICPNIVMVLEGGYNLKSVADSSQKCFEALLSKF